MIHLHFSSSEPMDIEMDDLAALRIFGLVKWDNYGEPRFRAVDGVLTAEVKKFLRALEGKPTI